MIGEATKNIPEAFKHQYPDIPWKRMAGMRDKLIHHYFEVDYTVVWQTAKQFIPPLKQQIKVMLTTRTHEEKKH